MYRSLIPLITALMFSGCADVTRFERDALVAHAEQLEGSQEPLYYSISLDFEKPLDARTAGSLLRFSPEGPAFALGALQPGLVARYLPPFIPPPQWPETWKQKAKEYDAYAGGGFHIRFKEGRLLSVGICSHCAGGREHPVVGTPDRAHFYTLPLTEAQLIEVFGHPDRIHKVHEVRY